MIDSETKKVKLSIIIAAWNNADMLRRCLLSLTNQAASANAEVIVVSNFVNGLNEIKREFPFADYQILPCETSIPELRTRGILKSKGEIVALSEDLCAFQVGWCEKIIQAHDSEFSIIGGGIENAENQSSLDWAVFLYDYGRYLPDDNASLTDALSEINISYKRRILFDNSETYRNGFSEIFVNNSLKAAGYKLLFLPAAVVTHYKNYAFSKIVLQFYQQARHFAARRAANSSGLNRFFFVSVSLFLPIILTARVIRQTIRKNRFLSKLIISLPYLFILMNVWAFGEFCGYLLEDKLKK